MCCRELRSLKSSYFLAHFHPDAYQLFDPPLRFNNRGLAVPAEHEYIQPTYDVVSVHWYLRGRA